MTVIISAIGTFPNNLYICLMHSKEKDSFNKHSCIFIRVLYEAAPLADAAALHVIIS